MRKLILICLAATMLLTFGCGGGGGDSILPPGGRDLSGLEGIWDYSVVWQGSMTGPGGTVPINMTLSGFCTITPTSITDCDGTVTTWSYDGTTLTLVEASTVSEWDPTCGNIYLSGTITLIIPIVPGGTMSNISGSCPMTMWTEYCQGTATGTLHAAGNFIKR